MASTTTPQGISRKTDLVRFACLVHESCQHLLLLVQPGVAREKLPLPAELPHLLHHGERVHAGGELQSGSAEVCSGAVTVR